MNEQEREEHAAWIRNQAATWGAVGAVAGHGFLWVGGKVIEKVFSRGASSAIEEGAKNFDPVSAIKAIGGF